MFEADEEEMNNISASENNTVITSQLVHMIAYAVTLLVAGGITYAIVMYSVNPFYIGLSFVFPLLIAILNSISQTDPFDVLALVQLFVLAAGAGIVFYVSAVEMPEKISSAAMTIGSLLTGVGLGGLPRFQNLRK